MTNHAMLVQAHSQCGGQGFDPPSAPPIESRHLNNLASDRQLGPISELANIWPKIMKPNGKEPYAMGLDVKARAGVTVASISISLSLSRSRAMRRAGAPTMDLIRPSDSRSFCQAAVLLFVFFCIHQTLR